MVDQKFLYDRVKDILESNPSKSFSREEILNLLSDLSKDMELERILAEIEVSSINDLSQIYATCQGGTVYFKWREGNRD